MKRLHESFGDTLERLLGRSRPSSARMESAINRVWERLHFEIVDASVEIAQEPVAVRRSLALPKIGFVVEPAAPVLSVVALLATFLRNLWHGGRSEDE